MAAISEESLEVKRNRALFSKGRSTEYIIENIFIAKKNFNITL